jgi:predicted enzyme related to lactoylglutathione lyase
MKSALNWFEIFVHDLDRAARFYEVVLDEKLQRVDFLGTPNAVFPHDEKAPGGALVKVAGREPGAGMLVYLPAEGKLDACIDRVARAGGEVVQKKTAIGPAGFIALIRDTEGNVLGLHSHN